MVLNVGVSWTGRVLLPVMLSNFVNGDNDLHSLLYSGLGMTFNSGIDLNLPPGLLFDQYSGYLLTSLYTYKVNLLSVINITSLIFTITGSYTNSSFINLITVRVYLLVSHNNLFNNTFANLKNMLYRDSKLYLLKEQFVTFFMQHGYNGIDLLNLYNNAMTTYSGLVNYIGIILMPDSELQKATYTGKCTLGMSYRSSLNEDKFQLLDLDSSVESFYTSIRLFQFEKVLFNSVLFGQYYNYPSTSLFTYNVNLTADVRVASLNFSIDGFYESKNFNSLTVRVYLLVSQDNLFNNIFQDLKNMLYSYSKLYLLKEQFVTFVMQPGYSCIDLLDLYNSAINKYSGLVNYIGIIVMPDNQLQTDVYCQAYNSRINLAISYEIVNQWVKNEEFILEKDKLVATFISLEKVFSVSFKLKPNAYSTFTNVIYLDDRETNKLVDGGVSSHIGVWFLENGSGKMLIESAVKDNYISYIFSKSLPLLEWSSILISQTKFNGVYIFNCYLNDKIIYSVENKSPKSFKNVKVYASSRWWDLQDASIKEIRIKNGNEEMPLLNMEYDATINETLVEVSFYLNYKNKSAEAVKLIWEYLLPSFVMLKSEITPTNAVKMFSSNPKYKISNLSDIGIYQNVTATINNTRCLFGGSYTIDIPIKLYFENSAGVSWSMFRTFRKNLKERCTSHILPTIPNHVSGYYGRGIYWDDANSEIYLCMNQHTLTMKKSACYVSKDNGVLWQDMDVRIGAILGHHISSGELYAIHRNQKLYLMFHNMLEKWLAVTNHDFDISILNNLNWTRLKTFDENLDVPKFTNFGTNQWMANELGLFFRKSVDDIWIKRMTWFSF